MRIIYLNNKSDKELEQMKKELKSQIKQINKVLKEREFVRRKNGN